MTEFDPWAQLKLLDLQAADSGIDQLDARLRQLPEQQRLREIAAEAEQVRLAELAAVTLAADIELEVRKSEDDVQAVRQRADRDRNLLDSGSIHDSKQLTDLQHEVETLSRRQSELEDIEIDVMQRLEEAQASVAELRAKLAELAPAMQAADQAVLAVSAEIAQQRAQFSEQRAAIAAELPAELLALYERIRSDNAGVGAAHLHQGRCQGCRIQLTPVALSAARKAAPSELLRCSECRAILVRNAESGL